MIDKAEKWLVFISPYLRTNKVLRQHLDLKFEKNFSAWLIYGKSELNTGEDKWWKNHTSVHMGYLENLHAKCYLSEQEAIVTSLNLYDFSQQNNNEMGIVLSKQSYYMLYEQVLRYAGKLIAFSKASSEAKQKWSIIVSSVSASVDMKQSSNSNQGVRKSSDIWSALSQSPATTKKRWVAYCIRCRKEVEPDDQFPYCQADRASWLEWQRENYKENFCHACGRDYDAIRTKPLCDRCFKKFNQGIEIFSLK